MKTLGIDIGGSGIKSALVSAETGEVLTERVRVKTPHPAKPDAVIEGIVQSIEGLDWDGPVGCGFPGVVKEQVVCTAANLHDSWVGVPLAQILEEQLKRRVWLLNDADAAGHAEMAFGAGRGVMGTVLLVTVGTGLGTAVFHEGKLFPNTELGHVYLKPHGQEAAAHAEHYAAAPARKRNDLKWPEWGNRLNCYLQHLELLVQPSLIIIGGGVARKFHKFESSLDLNVPVKAAQLLNQAGIIGAAAAAVRQFS